jgi:drug/metabolite transporter (DMT)-like permease
MKDHQRKSLAIVFAIAANAIFGFSFLFSKQALQVAAPFVLLAVRFTVAFALLNIMLLTGKFSLHFTGKRVGLLLVMGLIQPVAYFICEVYSVGLLPTSLIGTLLALLPIVSLAAARIFLKERARASQVFFSLLSVAGVFLTTVLKTSGDFSWLGFILIMGGVLAGVLYTVLSRSIAHEFSAFERTYVMFALGSAVFTLIALIQSAGNMREMILAPLGRGEFWVSIAFLAGLSSVGAFMMLNYAVTHLSVARTTIFANITTVITILAGVLILGESFDLYQAIGSVIIIVSAYMVNAGRKDTTKDPLPQGDTAAAD